MVGHSGEAGGAVVGHSGEVRGEWGGAVVEYGGEIVGGIVVEYNGEVVGVDHSGTQWLGAVVGWGLLHSERL